MREEIKVTISNLQSSGSDKLKLWLVFHTCFDIVCAFNMLKFPNHLLSKGSISSVCRCVSSCVQITCLFGLHSLDCLECSSMSGLYGLQKAACQLHHQDHQTRFLGQFPPTVSALTHSAIKTGTVYPEGTPPPLCPLHEGVSSYKLYRMLSKWMTAKKAKSTSVSPQTDNLYFLWLGLLLDMIQLIYAGSRNHLFHVAPFRNCWHISWNAWNSPE